MRSKKQRGFTLIELVIVVAIIGILALMIIPQFNKVTEEAKLNTFARNCKTVCSSLSIYQAGHDGNLPSDTTELGSVINGGWSSIIGKPTGAIYTYDGGVFSASYTDSSGVLHEFKYPQ